MSIEVLIVGGIVAVVGLLIAAIVWQANKKGYTTAQMDIAQNALDEIERINNAKKEIDTKLANTSRADKLRTRKYRD